MGIVSTKLLIKRFLDDPDCEALGRAVSTSYEACDQLMRSNVVLNSFMIGMEQRSRLISVFIDHALTKLNGFHYELRMNAARNCWHTRIHKNGLAVTAHFMGRGNARKMARKAVHRSALAERNFDLFEDEAPELEISIMHGYAWLLHGGFVTPKYASLAIPSRDQRSMSIPTELPLPAASKFEVEEIKEEIAIQLLSGKKEHEEGA